MHTCTSAHTHTHTHTRTHACNHTCNRACTYAHTHAHAHTDTCTHTHTQHTHTHAHIQHACTHARTHTHTHTQFIGSESITAYCSLSLYISAMGSCGLSSADDGQIIVSLGLNGCTQWLDIDTIRSLIHVFFFIPCQFCLVWFDNLLCIEFY